HGWNEVVEHAALPEQRMRTAFGGVRFQKTIVAKGFPGGTEQGQQRDGQRVQQPSPVAPGGGTDTDRTHAHQATKWTDATHGGQPAAEANILGVAEPALDAPTLAIQT